VIVFGAGLTGLVAFEPSSVRPWLLWIGWISAVIGVVLMTLAERATVGVSFETLLSSEAGGKFVLLALAVGLTGVAVLAALLRPGRASSVALAVTAAAADVVADQGAHHQFGRHPVEVAADRPDELGAAPGNDPDREVAAPQLGDEFQHRLISHRAGRPAQRRVPRLGEEGIESAGELVDQQA